jgi:heme/copper-type cytochrome/quinol oxidase subunit 2
MPMPSRGKVPHFTLRPSPGIATGFFLALIIGGLVSLSFFTADVGDGAQNLKGIATLMITAIICICLIIVATSKLWFAHLWKRNSTHERHKQHSRHHPSKKHRSPRH